MAHQDGANAASDTPSSHRLPTVSASQALHKLKSGGSRAISTGLAQLDAQLVPRALGSQPATNTIRGGLGRGQVTEIYGPPGVGKTVFGLQACKTVLNSGTHAVWIDAGAPLAKPRLKEMLSTPQIHIRNGISSSAPASTSTPLDKLLGNFHHYSTHTLAHLLVLCIHTPSFPPPGTSIVVIDSLSTLFDNAYPRTNDPSKAKPSDARWAAGRRYAVMNDLISKLGKMAAVRDITILLTNQVVTRFGSGHGLVPAMASMEWDNGIANRMVLFRDWPPEQDKLSDVDEERSKRIRFVGLVKAGGIALGEPDGLGAIVPFTVERSGLSDVSLASVELPVQPLASPAPVRTSKRSYAEVADSDDELGSDELYGWDEEDALATEGLIDEAALVVDLTKDSPHKKRASDND
ncbi:uncharacterized protein K452DRAFT_324951 [Aplosporella prunicola CBS 121167]|uniref:RecA family profile 1 domain-containing protein n=1 Tax=Aplosporella prunicola CBS 121167 TaxID=1176127 RepID=A0A6A6BR12_9PEZI|nr:uncharacterized protein K452DRAFT_324951 [Aplosporella prunicola CBS 121167]KAF2145247.1 hypothetical protein K452DRAFT_324951 [Aplosporella prunicola CBS 121167]